MSTDFKLAAEILENIETKSRAAERAIKRHFRKSNKLNNTRRARIARDVHGVRCYLRRLDHRLTQAGFDISHLNRIAAYRLDIDDEDLDTLPESFQTEEWRNFLHVEANWPEESKERLAIEFSLPDFIAARLLAQFGFEQAAQLANALNQAGPITIRARSVIQDRDTLLLALAKQSVMAMPCAYADNGLHLHARPDIRGCPLWQSGAYEVQDEGSQLIAQFLAPQPGDKILDLCAGAGGKSLALADLINEDGMIYAADVSAQRLSDLKVRLGRTQISCIQALHRPHDALPKNMDRVLVDAPCSATGTWRRGPDRKWRLKEEELKGFAALQLVLLNEGWNALKPGGRLVYATCSVLRDENQDVVETFQRSVTDCASQRSEWLLPHEKNTDGFYVAVLEKNR